MGDGIFEVVVPEMGDGVDTVTVVQWFAEEGELVEEGADLVELKTAREETSLTAPVTGYLTNIFFNEGNYACNLRNQPILNSKTLL